MFADSFWPNLLAVVLGQIAAWGYVRTGLLVRGALLMVVGLAAADVALVARFAFSHTGAVYLGALLVLQVWSLAELGSTARLSGARPGGRRYVST